MCFMCDIHTFQVFILSPLDKRGLWAQINISPSNWGTRVQTQAYLTLKPRSVYQAIAVLLTRWLHILFCVGESQLIYLYLLLFNYSCPHFSTITLPCPTHSPPPTCNPPPHSHCLCPWILYTCSLTWPIPFFPLLSPPPLPSGHCKFVLYFHVYGSILLTGLFCGLGSTYRWDHTVFLFHHLAYFT